MTIHQTLELSDIQFARLCEIIHTQTGITIASGRKSLLLSRLRGHLREANEPNFKSYIARVTSDADEMQQLINRVTTNKTLFYRTPRIWDHFQNHAVPEFRAKMEKRSLRVWSAAASTGEEAHTIGILLERVRMSAPGFNYSVLGSDVSSRVLKVAEAGLYQSRTMAAFQKDQPELFRTFMIGDDAKGYQVTPEIKSRLKFKLHNLIKPLKRTSLFDAVFLRNVLIYFTIEDQETILRNVLNQMAPDGTLYIGESENLSRLNTGFEQLEPMVYRPAPAAQRSDG